MRILLAEDEEKVGRFIVRGLKAEGYAVDAVADGNEARDYFSDYAYDLIILDLSLPGLSGTELLRHIRGKNATVPVLILTARDSVADKVRHIEGGADDYLTKPFSFAELQVRIKALLRRGAVDRSSVLRVSDLELDRTAHQVRRQDNTVELTAKEFSLLEYLMVNTGRVLSRTMIIEHVWDQSFEGLTNIVDVYIRQLRKKIDDAHELKLIHTVRGVGYTIGPGGMWKQPRSIRARLITLYAVTLALIFVCFGGYTYWGFKVYLIRSLQETLFRRAHQIAGTILEEIPDKGEGYVGSEIQARYAPELNERIIRVTGEDGRTLYASRYADLLASPLPVPQARIDSETKPVDREEMVDNVRFQVVAIGHRLENGHSYTVEVGGPESGIFSALDGLLKTLALGFPPFLILTSLGAYGLIGRALRPVEELVGSAERITSQNLSRRLPVPATGDEVERLSLALNRMIQRLDEAFELTNRFTGDASHELRTPLTIMRGELEALLHEGKLGEDQSSQVASVLEEVDRLTQIVEGLLLMSRLESGDSHLSKKPVDLAHLVSSTAEQMTPLAEAKDVTLVCEAGPAVMVEAHEIRLKQIVVNLVDNAIKYTPEKGRITVRVLDESPWAVLEVRDSGIGISPEALPHVFERFYRSEQPQARKAQGTGLGLSMVASIVEAHAGKVTVESHENEGAVFRVRLPKLERGAVAN